MAGAGSATGCNSRAGEADGVGSESPTALPENEDGFAERRPGTRPIPAPALRTRSPLLPLQGSNPWGRGKLWPEPSLSIPQNRKSSDMDSLKKMETVEDARVALVSVAPAVVFYTADGMLRIEMAPLEAWRLRNLLDSLLARFSENEFEAQAEAEFVRDCSSPSSS